MRQGCWLLYGCSAPQSIPYQQRASVGLACVAVCVGSLPGLLSGVLWCLVCRRMVPACWCICRVRTNMVMAPGKSHLRLSSSLLVGTLQPRLCCSAAAPVCLPAQHHLPGSEARVRLSMCCIYGRCYPCRWVVRVTVHPAQPASWVRPSLVEALSRCGAAAAAPSPKSSRSNSPEPEDIP